MDKQYRMTREEAIQELTHELRVWESECKSAHPMKDALRMAIEALKADAVSREECDECKTDKEGVLLQQLAELQGDYETMKNAYEDALADAEWIPCSERLPSDDEYVIVSVLDDHGDTPWKYTTVAWLCNGTWIADNEILFGDVIAWMPLPMPYKGGDSE